MTSIAIKVLPLQLETKIYSMKKSLLIFALGAIVAVPAQAGVRKNVERHALPERLQAVNKIVENVKKANEKKVWKPGTMQYFNWNEYENDWDGGSTLHYEYYPETGLIKSRSGDGYRAEFEYDSNGQITVMYDYYAYIDVMPVASKTTYKYDEILTDFCIEQLDYTVNDNEFVLSFGYRKNIVRNSDGNIVKIQGSYYNNWEENPEWKDDEYYLTIEYGADGRATTIYDMYLDSDTGEWKVEEALTNITWYATDGQITDYDWDDEDFYFGANRIKSADVRIEYSDEPARLSVVYPAENAVKYEATWGDEVVESLEFQWLDAYGSYEKTEYSVDYDFNEDTNAWEREEACTYYLKRIYDAYGYQISSISRDYYDGILDYQSESAATVTYDSQYGYPTEYILTRSRDGEAPVNEEKVLLSDYVQVTDGVENVTVSDENAPVEYFNLQGVRVNNPQGGIFIRRQGSRTTKVVL